MIKRTILFSFLILLLASDASAFVPLFTPDNFMDYNVQVVSNQTTAGHSQYSRGAANDENLFLVWTESTEYSGSGSDDDIAFKIVPIKDINETVDLNVFAAYPTYIISTESVGTSNYPDIAINDENVFIVWKDDSDYIDDDGKRDVFMKFFPIADLNGDSNFATGFPTIVVSTESTDEVSNNEGPAIEVNDENVFVAFTDNTFYAGKKTPSSNTPRPAFKYHRIADLDHQDANTWNDSNTLLIQNQDLPSAYEIDVAADEDNIYIVWSHSSGWGDAPKQPILFKYLKIDDLNYHMPWPDNNIHAVSTEVTGNSNNRNPRLSVNDGNIFIAWRTNFDFCGATVGNKVFFKHYPISELDYNGHWYDFNTKVVDTENINSANAIYPDVYANDENVFFVFQYAGDYAGNGGDDDIVLKYMPLFELDNNCDATSDLNVWTVSTGPDGDSEQPSFFVNDSNLYVTWFDASGNTYSANGPLDDIFFKGISSGLPPSSGNSNPDVNVVYPSQLGLVLSNADANVTDGNITIDFNVSDADLDGSTGITGSTLTADIYYSTTANSQTNSIVADLNLLAPGICDDLNFAGADGNNAVTCHWDFNLMGLADGNYFIDINLSDGSTSTADSSDHNFQIDFTISSVIINSPTQGSSTSSAIVTISYTASNPAEVATYWVKKDDGVWIDNGTSTTYSFAVGGSGDYTLYVKATDIGDNNSADVSVAVKVELAAGAAYCGNGRCDAGETACNCITDCAPICGDGCCTTTENPKICPEDCLSICRDGLCTGDETAKTCPEDCGSCGNGICNDNESYRSCPEDCRSCGNQVCECDENPLLCPEDCEWRCGDGVCSAIENAIFCPLDCFCWADEDCASNRMCVAANCVPILSEASTCTKSSCSDGNPCTEDVCAEGTCAHVMRPEGTTCGFGMECISGECTPTVIRTAGVEGLVTYAQWLISPEK